MREAKLFLLLIFSLSVLYPHNDRYKSWKKKTNTQKLLHIKIDTEEVKELEHGLAILVFLPDRYIKAAAPTVREAEQQVGHQGIFHLPPPFEAHRVERHMHPFVLSSNL